MRKDETNDGHEDSVTSHSRVQARYTEEKIPGDKVYHSKKILR